MKAVLCPVCNGKRKVTNGIYSRLGDYTYCITGGTNTEICRSCDGKGWTEVHGELDSGEGLTGIIYWPLTPRKYFDVYPHCGDV